MMTFSQLPRLMACLASGVLPHAKLASIYAEAGREEHVELSNLDALPDRLRALIPPGARSEVKLAWDAATDQGRIIGEGADRGYGELAPFEIAGSADVIADDGDEVFVLDWKTGRSLVDPAARNWQLWGLALAAARALGRTEARVMLVYPNRGDEVDEHQIDALELDAFGRRVAQLFPGVIELQRQFRKGQALSVSEGTWCKYCPAKAHCPAKIGMLLQLAGGASPDIVDNTLTPARALHAYQSLVRAEDLVKQARERLDKFVDEQGPIDLGNGRAYGRYSRRGNEKLDAGIVREAIVDVIGGAGERDVEAFLQQAFEVKATKAGIKRAAKPYGAKIEKAILGRTRELGGIQAEMRYPIGEYVRSEYPEAIDTVVLDAALAEAGE